MDSAYTAHFAIAMISTIQAADAAEVAVTVEAAVEVVTTVEDMDVAADAVVEVVAKNAANQEAAPRSSSITPQLHALQMIIITITVETNTAIPVDIDKICSL